ncbi:hypothetical protein [Desulfoplanes sp.]
MIVYDKKHFSMGLILAAIFFGVLTYMFSPSFTGAHEEKVNAFHASDNLFNSIAKGSTNYFPRLKEENMGYKGHTIDLRFQMDSPELATKSALIMEKAGIVAAASNTSVTVKGDLHTAVSQAIRDAENMFHNKGDLLETRYGMEGKETLFVWWKIFKTMDVGLKHQKDFKAAKFVSEVVKRGLEVGYNFYGVVPQNSTTKAGMLVFSLTFYVVYTLLWGFAIFYLFEGIGLQMSSGNKKEM